MIEWRAGLNGFREHRLDGSHFTTILNENDFEGNRNIDAIFLDHLKDLNGPLELLYSGGADSELILAFCVRNKIPVEAITMVIKARGAILNVVDLYYSEKFCRENNVKHRIVELNALEFYESGKYLEYLLPFNIIEPHVASHFWLIEQCYNFPVIGGDWPWVQAHKEKKILSPYKLAFSSYERFMNNKGIVGIGNMISHSYESCYYFMRKHIENYEPGNDKFHTVPFLKYKMYGFEEPRIKSYGWERTPVELFNINRYKIELIKKLGTPNAIIKWGQRTKQLLGADTFENSTFI